MAPPLREELKAPSPASAPPSRDSPPLLPDPPPLDGSRLALAHARPHADLLRAQEAVDQMFWAQGEMLDDATQAELKLEVRAIHTEVLHRLAEAEQDPAARRRLDALFRVEVDRMSTFFAEEVPSSTIPPLEPDPTDAIPASASAAPIEDPAPSPARSTRSTSLDLKASGSCSREPTPPSRPASDPDRRAAPGTEQASQSPSQEPTPPSRPAQAHRPPSQTEQDRQSPPQEGTSPPRATRELPLAPRLQRQQRVPGAPEPLHMKAGQLPPSYTVNTVVAMDEDDVQEFKDYSIGTSEGWELMQNAVRRTVNSFLNRAGGRMFFGITDEGLVKGIALTKKQRDRIRLEWDSIVNTMWPQVDIRDVDYVVRFINVVTPQGTALTNKDGTPICVAVISVEEDPNLREMGVYFTDKNCINAFTRASASCQRMSWQLVKDRIRRANQLRESKGIPPINLAEGHYTQYEVFGSGNARPKPPPPPASSSTAKPPIRSKGMLAPLPVRTQVAPKRTLEPFQPDTKRPRYPIVPAPSPSTPKPPPYVGPRISPTVSPTSAPLPPVPDDRNRRSSIQSRQMLQYLDRQRKQQQQ